MNDHFKANNTRLTNDNVSIIVPANHYDVRGDNRILIPIISHHKIGFINNDAEIIVNPAFDKVYGEARNQEDLIRVAKRYSYSIPGKAKEQPYLYDRDKWGVIDSKGKLIVDIEYKGISISDDKEVLTLHDYTKGYCAINRNGNVIVPFGKYDYIDGFSYGYARVKRGKTTNGRIDNDNLWGIINTKGEEVLPLDYAKIWKFHEKHYLGFTTVETKDSVRHKFLFSEGKLNTEMQSRLHNDVEFDSFHHYGEYAGTYAQDVMGYDDDTINDAFDGDPDAYWNID